MIASYSLLPSSPQKSAPNGAAGGSKSAGSSRGRLSLVGRERGGRERGGRERGGLARGFGIVEVLVAVVVMAVGLMILAGMQGRLIESGSDAKARTVATRLASDQIDSMRRFVSFSDYLALDSSAAAQSIALGGTTFSRSWTVSRFRFNPDPNGDGNQSDAAFVAMPAGSNTTAQTTSQPEFKRVDVTVGWTSAAGQARQAVLSDLISSAAPRDSLNIIKSLTGTQALPKVRIYAPSDVGVIPIAIGTESGNTVDSASSNPKPTQYVTGTTGTTQFTVQTYLADQANPLLQHQIDFAYTSCYCAGSSLSTAASPAYGPTYWDGLRYVPPKVVIGKKTGTLDASVDQDPEVCGTCCRDHHDLSTETVKVDPWRNSNAAGVTNYYASGDHYHYDAKLGFATPSSDVGSYSESCRMVRVDGTYQVATDTRLEDVSVLRMTAGASGPTLSSALSTAYGNYAKAYVTAAYNEKPAAYPVGGLPVPDKTTVAAAWVLAAGDTYGAKFLDPPHTYTLSQVKNDVSDFASRGLYIDWLSPEALTKIACIGSAASACGPYKNMTLPELLPFVAVNLTDLTDWSSTAAATVSVRNDALPLAKNGGSSTPYVRGETTAVANGNANAVAIIKRSNSGLIDTRGIDPQDAADTLSDQEELVVANAPPTSGTYTVTIGDSTGDANFAAQNIKVEMDAPVFSTPVCTRAGLVDTCTYDLSATSILMRWANYNYPSCTYLGAKWTYDAVGNQCVLPPQNKNGTTQYGVPQIRNFALCSVSSPTNKVTVSGLTVYNDGLTSEYTTALLSASGGQPNMGVALNGVAGTFTATFKTTCP